ncbi:MAG: MaoC family dehydratase [Deltaproteobacteria bacterium]|nr:MaoC family dehydratase [Deltaproteobacteria bacterium]
MTQAGEGAATFEAAQRRVGQELGASDWLLVDQARIDAHAATTGDADFLHNDPARAAREGPFGRTIAQGSLLLSMLVGFVTEIAPLAEDVSYALNYGFDRLRFVRPVLEGSRVRARMKLDEVRPRGDGRYVVVLDARLEVEGQSEPALVAKWLGLVAPRS